MSEELKEILTELERQLPTLSRKYGVSRIGVFGSYAKGKQTAESDVDLLVEFSEPIGMFQFLRLESQLSKLLGRKVDLVTKDAIKLVVKEGILQHAVYAQA